MIEYIGYTILFVIIAYFVYFGYINTGCPKKLQDVEGKHIVITGGSAGLGLSIAKKFVKMGANITIIARNPEKLKKAKEEIEKCKSKSSQKVLSLSCDVTKWVQVESTVQKCVSEIGVPDYVIANAGQSFPGYFANIPIETMDKEMQINYFGVLYLIKAALPSMIERNKGGHIVIVSSAVAFFPIIGYSNYAGTKCALKGYINLHLIELGLAEALRNELLLYGIDVSIFFPTNIDTEGFAEENKTKPAETHEIEGKASTYPPDTVADSLIDAMKKGQFYIGNEFFPTELGRLVLHGLAPRHSFLLDIILTPIITFLTPLFRFLNDSVVLKSKAKNKKNQ